MRNKKGFSCRIDPKRLELFKEKTRREGVTQSEVIEILIQSYLDNEIKIVRRVEVNK